MKFIPKDKPKKEFNQSKNLILASYLLIASLTLLTWNSYFQGSFKGFSIPSLLAMLAFGFMWVHYLASYLKTNYQPDLDTSRITKITQLFVLVAIIAHPIAIVSYLHKTGYGLPPASFKGFFGPTGKIFVTFGSIALFAFLLFEFKKYFQKRPKLWSAVLKFNDIAMLLIILHGFKLGFVINSTWFKYVWLAYGLSLLYFFYDKYVLKRGLKKYVELFIVGLVVLMMTFIGLAIPGDPRSKAPVQQDTTFQDRQASSDSEGFISVTQLSKNDGLEGRKCWIAVDGEVYDASNNPQWKDGQHTPSGGLAKCGQDLTEVIRQSPHGTSVLGELPVVGELRN